MLQEILSRLKAPTPKFFKKVQVAGGSLAAMGLGLTQIPGASHVLVSLGTHAIVAGGVIVLVAKFAIENVSDDADSSTQKTD